MSKVLKEEFSFVNDVKIPVLGLGTWQMTPEEAEESVAFALKNGYIHIDTARTYGNEEGVGRGMKKAGVAREDYFLTTKVSGFSKTYEEAKQDIVDSLKALDTSYLDLVIIHAPRPWNEMDLEESEIENYYYEENAAVWRALEEAYAEGTVKAIGVSNFEKNDLDNLFEHAEVKPMLNQIKYHIGHEPVELVEYCKENDMIVEAYSPLGTGKLLTNEAIQKVADQYDKSVAQIAIRYAYQKDLVVLPKSVHEQYIIENSEIDFEITDEDMEILSKL